MSHAAGAQRLCECAILASTWLDYTTPPTRMVTLLFPSKENSGSSSQVTLRQILQSEMSWAKHERWIFSRTYGPKRAFRGGIHRPISKIVRKSWGLFSPPNVEKRLHKRTSHPADTWDC